MLLELSPTIEVCVDLQSFYNVDLCHRGYYQVRCHLKIPSGRYAPAKVDITIPRSTAPHLFPASVVEGQAVGKTIEVMYAHENVPLLDQINFTIKLPTRVDKLASWLEMVLTLELWFLEKDKMLSNFGSSDVLNGFRCVSCRQLLLRMSLSRGLHWHRPVLFDYYHLAAVTVTVHASLVGLESKWKKIKKAYHSTERDNKGSESPVMQEKLRNYHKNACKLMLSSYESVQLRIRSYVRLLPPSCQIRIQMVDTISKLDALCRRLQGEPDPWVALDQDRILLSQELCVLWNQFLELFRGNLHVIDALNQEHHNTRVKRFAEGFFCSEDTVQSLISSGFSSSSQSLGLCARLVDMLKRSSYFAQLPQLPIACDEMDGTGDSMPVIFEEKYLPPTLSRQASRLPSVAVGEAPEPTVCGRRSGNRLSPEKMLRALKSSLCLDLKHMNKPAVKDDSELTNGVPDGDDQLVEIELQPRGSPRGRSPAPVYQAVDDPQLQRCATEPNLVQERERETSFLESVIGRANSEADVSGVHLLLSDTAVAPVKQNSCPNSARQENTRGESQERSSGADSEDSATDVAIVRSPVIAAAPQLTAGIDSAVVEFVRSKEQFKERLSVVGYNGHLCSDLQQLASKVPYFSEKEPRLDSKLHLIICVHGLDGCKEDLDPYRTYLRLCLPDDSVDFLMSEGNQNATFDDFITMSRNLVDEILLYLSTCETQPKRISFIAHSLGNIIVRAALGDPRLCYLEPRWHCYLSLNAPHLGVLYNQKTASLGVSLVQWWKRSRSLEQLMLRDKSPQNMRDSFLYRLSENSSVALFKYVLLVGSSQDMYVPCHSALMQPCKAAQKDSSDTGTIYGEMVSNLLASLCSSSKSTTVVRYTAFHGMAGVSRTHQVMGRAAHIAVLDDDLFIEKLLTVSALKYFI